MQFNIFQPKSSEPFQEPRKRLPSCSADVEMEQMTKSTYKDMMDYQVLDVTLWKELAKEQVFRIGQSLGIFLKSA